MGAKLNGCEGIVETWNALGFGRCAQVLDRFIAQQHLKEMSSYCCMICRIATGPLHQRGSGVLFEAATCRWNVRIAGVGVKPLPESFVSRGRVLGESQARLGISAFLRSIRDEHLEQLNPGAALSDPFKSTRRDQGWRKTKCHSGHGVSSQGTRCLQFAAGSHAWSCLESQGIRRTKNACIFHRH